jgi:hypothetical protein
MSLFGPVQLRVFLAITTSRSKAFEQSNWLTSAFPTSPVAPTTKQERLSTHVWKVQTVLLQGISPGNNSDSTKFKINNQKQSVICG